MENVLSREMNLMPDVRSDTGVRSVQLALDVLEAVALSTNVQDEIAALVEKMRMIGPMMKRPRSDTLTGSRFANMKELRFEADNGVWRVAYAFDPTRRAILLVAGDKAGVSQKRFYKSLIQKADQRFATHLKELERRGSK
jgi:hypothetical protein